MSDDNSLLKGRNLTRRFQRGKNEIILALNDTDLDIQRSKLTMIFGPSGSGKTTLLNVLSGLDTPDEGRIIWDNVNIVEWDEDRLSHWRSQAIGFVFQTFEVIPNLTALENVMVPLYPSKLKTSEIKVDALSLLKQVGIFDTTNERARRLSGGEQQRVALARALITKPKLVFADEPTGNLDEDTGRKVLELLRRQTRGHDRAVVVVSHNQSLQSYADIVYEMRQGKLSKTKG
ncbi:MAG: putative ABC transporter ATP-binding protein [Candidatus Heimdallarchaeota archaeon LC_3]|nr:MAG: putative ABC transporter ATP-binding protein [Candidatus Heimdallarchaeota archaeon LC_3]